MCVLSAALKWVTEPNTAHLTDCCTENWQTNSIRSSATLRKNKVLKGRQSERKLETEGAPRATAGGPPLMQVRSGLIRAPQPLDPSRDCLLGPLTAQGARTGAAAREPDVAEERHLRDGRGGGVAAPRPSGVGWRCACPACDWPLLHGRRGGRVPRRSRAGVLDPGLSALRDGPTSGRSLRTFSPAGAPAVSGASAAPAASDTANGRPGNPASPGRFPPRYLLRPVPRDGRTEAPLLESEVLRAPAQSRSCPRPAAACGRRAALSARRPELRACARPGPPGSLPAGLSERRPLPSGLPYWPPTLPKARLK